MKKDTENEIIKDEKDFEKRTKTVIIMNIHIGIYIYIYR